MRIEIVKEALLGARAAEVVAEALRTAVAARGRATVAFSGGTTARPLLRALVGADVPWSATDVLQVDERVAPGGHPDRNLTALRRDLVDHVPLPAARLHAMPVEAEDLDGAAAAYADVVHRVAGRPATIDVVHLGIGADGHTASLIPGGPWRDEGTDPVAVTAPYQGRRRMTLTLSTLSAARRVLWLVSGAAKAPIVRRLVEGDSSIPAGAVEASRAVLLVDPAAAGMLASGSASAADR